MAVAMVAVVRVQEGKPEEEREAAGGSDGGGEYSRVFAGKTFSTQGA